MAKKMFTEAGLERLRAPESGRIEYGDSVVPGLMLRVSDTGVKSWSVLYKVKGEGGASPKTGRPLKGTQRRISIGTYPVIGVKQARETAMDVLQKAFGGTDARVVRNQALATRQSNTFEAVAKRFIEQDAKATIESWSKIERAFELHVYPAWADRTLADIRRRDVHELLDGLIEKGKTGTASDVRKHLSRLFNWAIDREIITENPLSGLKRKDLQYKADAGRALTDDELRAIWRAADRINYPFGPFFKLMILTGQRRNEWAEAKHSEICPTRKVLEVPKARFKGRRDHVVPLSPLAWAIYETMPRWNGKDPYVFSTQGGEVPISGFSKAKAYLDELAQEELRKLSGDPEALLGKYRIHDIRVTCESRLADLGFNQDVRDAVLGHAKVGLQRTYNKHDYADEKRRALDRYAEHILGVVGVS
ncbi:MAG: tyrosine-type recombinase/integrase [Hyphomicrobium sp.]